MADYRAARPLSAAGKRELTVPKDQQNRPRRRAVALRYDAGNMAAPEVSASGQGYVADRIIALAQEYGVPVREDPTLVELLAQLDIGQAIPPELYTVIAEVLAFVYRLKGGCPADERLGAVPLESSRAPLPHPMDGRERPEGSDLD